MIRFKEKEFDQYSICPATGDIFDAKTGVVQETYMHNGRLVFKGMGVHCIQVHTFYGYKPRMDIHHLDKNKLNNALSNLIYLTRAEHITLHNKNNPRNKGKNWSLSDETKAKIAAASKNRSLSEETKAKLSAALKGRTFSEESKAKMSAAHKGKSSWNKGKQWSEETKAKLKAAALQRWANRRKNREL